MINLLSKENKKMIKREYELRLITLVFKALAVLAVAGFLLLVPSYLLTLKRSQAFLDRAETIKNNPNFQSQGELNELIMQTRKQTDLFKNKISSNITERILAPVLDYVKNFSPDIQLTGFLYEEKEKGKPEVMLQIRGNAKSREALLALVDEMRQEKLFEKLEVPVSDLAKKDNIDFVLNLDLAKKDIYE